MALVLSKDGNPDIYLLNLKSALTRLTRHFAIDTEPTWMPDGKSLLFITDRGGRPQIYRYDMRTQKVRGLFLRGVTTPGHGLRRMGAMLHWSISETVSTTSRCLIW